MRMQTIRPVFTLARAVENFLVQRMAEIPGPRSRKACRQSLASRPRPSTNALDGSEARALARARNQALLDGRASDTNSGNPIMNGIKPGNLIAALVIALTSVVAPLGSAQEKKE